MPLFDWWKVIALLALRQAEHAGSDLFGKVGRPNLEIIWETILKARWPKRECQLLKEVRLPRRARGEEWPLDNGGNGYNPCLLSPCNRRRLIARSFTRKREEWNSISVQVSLVNLWTESKLQDHHQGKKIKNKQMKKMKKKL